MMENEKIGILLIAIISVGVLVSFQVVGPVAQDNAYHDFSDTNSYFLIPNTLNIVSNLLLILVGVLGLLALRSTGRNSLTIISSLKPAYCFLFLGAALVGIGSSYYHWRPNNETLVWDRIPMTIAFMAIYSIIIGEFVSEKLGRLSLVPFLMLGVGSVLYWWFTESRGIGDLRYYAVVQFFPILTIPILLYFFKSAFNCVWAYWLLLGSYVAAKLFEAFDKQVHEYLGVVSGHSIKHVLPAIGLYILLVAYKRRSA